MNQAANGGAMKSIKALERELDNPLMAPAAAMASANARRAAILMVPITSPPRASGFPNRSRMRQLTSAGSR